MARGPQAIDGEARDDGGEPRLRTFDIAGALPAKPRVLDDVLGVGHRSEHPVGEAENRRRSASNTAGPWRALTSVRVLRRGPPPPGPPPLRPRTSRRRACRP